MSTSSVPTPDSKAITEKKTFSRTTVVRTEISAAPAIIWKLLTNASDYPRWNSTIVSIEGEIQKDAKIKLKSTLDTNRTFKLKVSTFEPEKQLAWGDGLGKRTYTLEPKDDGNTRFTMHEKIGGLMFPLFASKIPSFDELFEQFAADLKKKAERMQKEAAHQ